MTFPLKSLLLASTLGFAALSHAAGIPVVDDGLDASVKQAQTMADQPQEARAQAPVAQAETLPGHLRALTSTYAERVKAAQTPSADTNQQILAQLIGINTTLTQLLELEHAKSAAAAH